jgi:type I restriction enzyme M protein
MIIAVIEANMKEKIFNQMMDSFHATTLTFAESLELAIQILAWVKLTATKSIPEELQLNAALLNDHPSRALDVLNKLGQVDNELMRQAFSDGKRLNNFNPILLRPVLDLALRVSDTGILQGLDIINVVTTALSKDKYSGELFLPLEVASLLIELSGICPGDSVYTPWDSCGQLAARAVKNDAEVYLENPLLSAIPAIISLLTEKPFEVHYADPIRNPSAIDGGKLHQFDVAIASPPFNVRYDIDVITKDWFGRFPERTPLGSVLSIRHLLSQTSRRVVVTVPNTLLFSGGTELALRQDLLKGGHVKAVVAMPTGLFPTINIPFAILILDPAGGCEHIKFINAADSPRFYEPISKARSRLVNIEELVKQILEPEVSEDSAIVPVSEVLANNAQLQVNRYVLPDIKKRLQAKLANAKIVVLGDLITTVRPMPTTSIDEDSIEAWEIGAADLPSFGYINAPGRLVKVESQIASKNEHQFLRPHDIVLIIKGSVGKVGIVPENAPPSGPGGWVAGQSAIVLRTVREAGIDPRLLTLQLRSPFGKELLNGIVSGAVIQLIQLKELIHLPILVPDIETGRHALEALEREADLQQQIDRLRQEQAQVASDIWTLT